MNILEAFPRQPWDHQIRFAIEILEKLKDSRTVVGMAPTGAGKGLVTSALVRFFADKNRKTILYNNKRTLTQQSWERYTEDDIHCGVRAASMKREQNLWANTQLATIQTDIARVVKQQCWNLHEADLVIIDEAHLCRGPKALELMQQYLARGSRILGLTGTPVGMSDTYNDIVVACANSELLAIGAHVPMTCYGVSEMDVGRVRRVKSGEISDATIAKNLWSQAVVGRIYEDWARLNPDGRPTLAATPGVGESVWLAERFRSFGHKAAHIDAKYVFVNGERYQNDTNGTIRTQVLNDAKRGEFTLVSNCQVIQEGFDWPSLEHVILARPYLSLANYLQAVGRGLRGSEGKSHCIVQDHGGNIVRHGHPNDDRNWRELFTQDEKEIADSREADIQNNNEREPITCAKCGMIRTSGARCPGCGFMSDGRVRMIVEQDGTLVKMEGSAFKPKPKPKKPPEVRQLEEIYFRMLKHNGYPPGTEQVMALYKRKHGDYPSRDGAEAWTEHRELKRREWEAKRGQNANI